MTRRQLEELEEYLLTRMAFYAVAILMLGTAVGMALGLGR